MLGRYYTKETTWRSGLTICRPDGAWTELRRSDISLVKKQFLLPCRLRMIHEMQIWLRHTCTPVDQRSPFPHHERLTFQLYFICGVVIDFNWLAQT